MFDPPLNNVKKKTALFTNEGFPNEESIDVTLELVAKFIDPSGASW